MALVFVQPGKLPSLTADPDPTGLQMGIHGGQLPVSTVVGGSNRSNSKSHI
jgi:hypothetical protein